MGSAIPSHDAPPENQVRGRLFAGANGSRIPRAKIALELGEGLCGPQISTSTADGDRLILSEKRDGEILKR